MASMKSRGFGASWRSSFGAAVSSVALGLWAGGCGGAGAEVAPTEAEAGSEDRSSQSSGAEASGHPLEGTTTAASNRFAVPEDASDEVRQAEWLRSQQVREFRVLEMQVERGSMECDEAESARQEICDLSDRICAQADVDRAAASRCDDAMERCGAARPLAQQACGS